MNEIGQLVANIQHRADAVRMNGVQSQGAMTPSRPVPTENSNARWMRLQVEPPIQESISSLQDLAQALYSATKRGRNLAQQDRDQGVSLLTGASTVGIREKRQDYQEILLASLESFLDKNALSDISSRVGNAGKDMILDGFSKEVMSIIKSKIGIDLRGSTVDTRRTSLSEGLDFKSTRTCKAIHLWNVRTRRRSRFRTLSYHS